MAPNWIVLREGTLIGIGSAQTAPPKSDTLTLVYAIELRDDLETGFEALAGAIVLDDLPSAMPGRRSINNHRETTGPTTTKHTMIRMVDHPKPETIPRTREVCTTFCSIAVRVS